MQQSRKFHEKIEWSSSSVLNYEWKPKVSRTILVLGPPHSGKSIFTYILCEELRKLGNDAAVFECDTYAPSLFRIMGSNWRDYCYPAAHVGKRYRIPPEYFQNGLKEKLRYVVQKGIVVLDGVGQHTESTELLIKNFTSRLIIVCSGISFNDDKLLEWGFKDSSNQPKHPFDFYEDWCKTNSKELCLKVTTYLSRDKPNITPIFNGPKKEATLIDLCVKDQHGEFLIKDGDYSKLSPETLRIISQIAKFILENYS